eukprot:TRINITY_DN11279_c0_g1_i1.p1 TRINITY_DN11279_c0_g1~~TRINITY_DN11279_c0_g1_i1.p1  ORF type:complete len:265 (+),score=49.26 TRINITY_DN11279_c0_g1_i1:155-949(+)
MCIRDRYISFSLMLKKQNERKKFLKKIEKSPFSGTGVTMSTLKNQQSKHDFLGPDILSDQQEYISDERDSQNCSQQFSSLSQLKPFYFKEELFTTHKEPKENYKNSTFQKKLPITFSCLSNLETYKKKMGNAIDQDSQEEFDAIEQEFNPLDVPNEILEKWNKINCSKDTFFKMPKLFKSKLKQNQDSKSLQQLPNFNLKSADNSPTLFNGNTLISTNALDEIDESQLNKIKKKIEKKSYENSDFNVSSSQYIQKLFKSNNSEL